MGLSVLAPVAVLLLAADAGAVEPAEEDYCGSRYNSWVAHGDVLFCQPHAGLCAIRLGIEQDALVQKVLWRLDAGADSRNPNRVWSGGRLYAQASQDRRRELEGADP
jgi:hypothetical protein